MKHARPDYQDRVVDLLEPRIYTAITDAELALLSVGSVLVAMIRRYGTSFPEIERELAPEVNKLEAASDDLKKLYAFLERPYGRRPIPDAEPVFLLRGQDQFAVATLRAWIREQRQLGVGDPELLVGAKSQAIAMQDWHNEHGAKVPDMSKAGEEDGLFDAVRAEAVEVEQSIPEQVPSFPASAETDGTIVEQPLPGSSDEDGTLRDGDGEGGAGGSGAETGHNDAGDAAHGGTEETPDTGTGLDAVSGTSAGEHPGPTGPDGVHEKHAEGTETA